MLFEDVTIEFRVFSTLHSARPQRQMTTATTKDTSTADNLFIILRREKSKRTKQVAPRASYSGRVNSMLNGNREAITILGVSRF